MTKDKQTGGTTARVHLGTTTTHELNEKKELVHTVTFILPNLTTDSLHHMLATAGKNEGTLLVRFQW